MQHIPEDQLKELDQSKFQDTYKGKYYIYKLEEPYFFSITMVGMGSSFTELDEEFKKMNIMSR